MFDNEISLNNILVSFEGTLKIEMAGNQKVQDIIDQAITRLENAYSCKFDRSVYQLQADNQLMADTMNILLRDIQQCLQQLAFYINLKLFHKNTSITLADVKYLGYSRDLLMTGLQYLMDVDMAKQHAKDVLAPMPNTLNNIPICSVKRLFIILLMLHRLGISEGVSIVAQMLYIGGLAV